MGKKVGIVSPYKDYNYGTVLQAFALYKKLDFLGVKSEYIDFSATANLSRWKRALRYLFHPMLLWRRLFFKQFINPIVNFLYSDAFKKNRVEFDEFIRKIPVSECYDVNTINKVDDKYCLFIVGSDQTWSPFLNDSQSLYFLNFTIDRKKNSYAPSIGTASLSDSYKELLKRKISKYNKVSCREHFGTILLSELTKRHVEEVLDPTLLLNASEWEVYEEPVKDMPNKFILVYQLGTRTVLYDYANKLSKKLDSPIVSLLTNEYTQKWSTTIDGIGPAQFLWLVHHAEIVVTDSFHGTLFSVNYQKQFFSFTKVEGTSNTYDNIRIVDILSCFGIEDRLIKDDGLIPNAIDYSKVNDALNTRKERSVCYLKSIINDIS